MTNGKIHICILTTAHPVDDVRVNAKFAQSFVAAGFRVTWVGPSHAFFDTEQHKGKSGIEFHLIRPNVKRLDRILASGQIRRVAGRIRDVDFYYTPEPDAASLALRLARGSSAKVILDLHEVYHGPLLDRWLGKLAIPLFREWMRRRISRICSRCDLVIAVSDAVLAPYLPDGKKGMVIRSCAPSWFAAGLPAEVCRPRHMPIPCMHGKRSLERGTIPVLEAVTQASRVARNLRVVMFHPGSSVADAEYPEFDKAVSRLQAGLILDLRSGVPMQAMPAILRGCDLGIIAYGRKLGGDSLPNRFFEYMAAGLPVLVPSYASEMVKIVEAEQCGLVVDFENVSEIDAALLKLWRTPEETRSMGARGREAFIKRHNWESEVQPLMNLIGNHPRANP